MDLQVSKYTEEFSELWDQFVSSTENSHFMFKRLYMDYHKQRFEDASLFILKKDVIVAVLPATICGDQVISHAGLSFGGLIYMNNLTAQMITQIFELIFNYFRVTFGIKTFIYKKMPAIYLTSRRQEDEYALHILGASLFRRDLSSVIEIKKNPIYSKRRMRSLTRARQEGLIIEKSQNILEYWSLLEQVLWLQHKVKPVHTACEMMQLHNNFPDNIKCYLAKLDNKIISGVMIFENKHVAHTQYLANSEAGRKMGALDFLIDHLLNNVFPNKYFLSLGISTENSGMYLNEGLHCYKQSFGASAIIHDQYVVQL